MDSDARRVHPSVHVGFGWCECRCLPLAVAPCSLSECETAGPLHFSCPDSVLQPRRPIAIAGGAAIPFSYGSSGSSGGARSEPSFQQVGYSYGDTAAPATGGPGDAGEAAEAEDEQHGEPFVAPFEVPESLQGSLPTTIRQHQVRGPLSC